jgi:predicted PurR-regulated permease PerM
LWSQAVAYLRQHSPEWIGFGRRQIEHPAVQQIADALGGQLKEVASGLLPGVKSALGGLRSAVAFLVGLALIPVYLFFLLRFTGDPLKLVHGLLPFMPDNIRDDVVFLVGEFVKLVVAFFRGQILVGLALGVFYATGFSIAGLKFGLVIGLAMGVGNMVPYLGTVLGLSVAIPLAFFQPAGGMWLAGTVLAVFAAAQTLDSTVLTPRIMGQQTGLPPLAIIVAIMFWGTALDGMLGMVLAIPLTAFLVTAWRLLKRKYILAASPNA